MREKIVGIIMYFLLLNLMNLFLLHHIIYSILIGNMKKSKHRYKKGTIIAHQYSLFERLKQDYIKKYISIFRKEYKFYMVLYGIKEILHHLDIPFPLCARLA